MLTLLLTALALATDPAVAKIQDHYGKVTRMTMRFTQVVHNPLYGDQQQTGTVALERPGRMRWNFEGDHKLYISDGSTWWVYLEQDKQAFRYRGMSSTGTPEALLTSLDQLDTLFDVKVLEPPAGGGTRLELTPRSEATYSGVQLEFDGQLALKRVVLADAMETRTEMRFTDLVLGPDLPADTFTFAPPAGVEVIDAGLPQ